MKNITFSEIEKMLFGGAEMQVSEEQLAGMERCYEFLINAVRQIKLTFAFAFDKDSKLIN